MVSKRQNRYFNIIILTLCIQLIDVLASSERETRSLISGSSFHKSAPSGEDLQQSNLLSMPYKNKAQRPSRSRRFTDSNTNIEFDLADENDDEKRFAQFRSDFGKRYGYRSDFGKRYGYRSDFGKRYGYRSDFGKRYGYRSDFGKRYGYRSDFGKRYGYRSDFGKRLYRSDFGKRSDENENEESALPAELTEDKRPMFRSDLGKRAASTPSWWYTRRVFRSDLGKRSSFRSDLG